MCGVVVGVLWVHIFLPGLDVYPFYSHNITVLLYYIHHTSNAGVGHYNWSVPVVIITDSALKGMCP